MFDLYIILFDWNECGVRANSWIALEWRKNRGKIFDIVFLLVQKNLM